MPRDDGCGFDDQENLRPVGPQAMEDGPEESVASVEGRPRMLTSEHGDLLAESKDLQGGIAS